VKSEEFYKTYLQYPQICTDSRKVNPGCLYFALRGDHFNGNDFASDALARGSAFAVVDDPGVVTDDRCILVPDVLKFLQELAGYHRNQLRIPVIGLTGTNGKTTTKELIHSVLKQKYRVVATSGNFNNHIGVPVTLLSAGKSTEILIVEMGANHPGEIEFLCRLARPTHGMITNIGKAHLEGFGSFEGVIRTKNELYESIRESGGKLFANKDDELLQELAGGYPAYTYGTSGDADIIGSADTRDRFLTVNWRERSRKGSHTANSHLTGGYNLHNILAAISFGVWFDLTPEQIGAGIESYVPDNMRSQWITTETNTLLLDAYNANPSSMELAVRHFASMKLPRSVAILGDMFELGVQSPAEHLKIIQLAEELGFDELFFTGPQFYNLASGYPYHFFPEVDGLKVYLDINPLTDSHILIKGSRGMQLEQLVSYL
jgi:UDP-N-acetylmuramoyl-tripeptide--D-alanyl-D-alanine ligase